MNENKIWELYVEAYKDFLAVDKGRYSSFKAQKLGEINAYKGILTALGVKKCKLEALETALDREYEKVKQLKDEVEKAEKEFRSIMIVG